MTQQATTQHEVLQRASLFLAEHQRETNVAQILLQHYLNVSRTAFFMGMRDPVPQNVVKKFEEAIKRHVETGIPVQHLMGYEMFYGRRYQVNSHVLIPRPETEELVQSVIAYSRQHDTNQPVTIADIGTGSGVIACTLALELASQAFEVYATDISIDALNVARKNAKELDAHVTFLQGDLLEPLEQHDVKPDIIVSNPPYIAKSERDDMSDTVLNHDPELALFADDNGLAIYRQLIEQAARVSHAGTWLALEIGHTQGQAVKELIEATYPNSKATIIKDINQKDRLVTAKLER